MTQQALLLSVRFYEGRYHGMGDWPPAPARLYQALMAGSACGAAVPPATREALDWLERLPSPVIAAPHGLFSKAYTNFVPNNDLDSELSKGKTPDLYKAVAAIRVGKRFRPILFNPELPVLYCWFIDDPDARTATICKTAENLYQLGRGIDMAWAEASVVDSSDAEERLFNHGGIVYRPLTGGGRERRELLCPRPGSGRSLIARFEGMRTRFNIGGTNRKPVHVFVQPPKPSLTKVAYDALPHRLVFDLREGDTAAFAAFRLAEAGNLVREVRDKAADRLRSEMPELEDYVERYLIGRGATEADKAMRVHIVPIPSVGHEHADMAVRRIAVYVPQSCPLRADDLAWAFVQVAWADNGGTIVRELRSVDDARMVERFQRCGKRWRSVMPLALSAACRRRMDPARANDELKGVRERVGEEVRVVAAVRQALRHARIDIPAVDIRVQREPFDRNGTRAEAFAVDTRFAKESLWHVEIVFARPVAGPLVLGDGRYLGLGLMLPCEPMHDVVAFAIEDGLINDARPEFVARAARRAMMARVDGQLPRDGKILPTYVSGHNEDGSPSGGGVHRHIAIVADLPRSRILYIPPNLLQRNGVMDWAEIAQDHHRMARALEGMDVLRAGRAGRLALAPLLIDLESDPLFASSRIWESVTDYDMTRHRRRLSDGEALKADVAAELSRCRWPLLPSDAIEILALRRGPRGGLAGRLRLSFPTAQAGPLLIGRSAHKGGGLFVGLRDATG